MQLNKSELGKDSSYRKRLLLIVLADIVCIAFSYLFALWVRFDFVLSNIEAKYLINLTWFIPVIVLISIFVYYFMRLYHSIWIFASVNELISIIEAYLILLVAVVLCSFIPRFNLPRSVFLMGYFFSGVSCVAIRFMYRFLRYINLDNSKETCGERVLLVGAGSSAREVIKASRSNPNHDFEVEALVDDNPDKYKRYLEGIQIEGNRHTIPELVKKHHINKIILAMPGASAQDKKAIINICKETNCKVQTVPSMAQIVNEDVKVSKIRDVEIEELLGREETHINLEEIYKSLENRVVMVTGGGGSIGSELCRQIARAKPKQLIIFDIYENNAYSIQQELKRKVPDLNLVTLIGSVRNTKRVDSVLDKYRPEIIFHAAAHKHVPLMEDSPNESIKNNVMGTYKVAQAAARYGVKRFLLISTDKAVNPTNIMGASKRLCEMVIQMMSRKHPETIYMAVRFGNVLGSNGSVIPLFKKQIAEGGPVTVTDPNIIRYFMTIPEAVSLVLEASLYAKGGEIFVLDMGEPVKIDDMARNLIKLSGLTPDVDIKVEYTGLRPGEKLCEELLMDEEGMTKTENKLIFIGHPIKMDDQQFEKDLAYIDEASYQEVNDIKEIVQKIVPTYHPDLETK